MKVLPTEVLFPNISISVRFSLISKPKLGHLLYFRNAAYTLYDIPLTTGGTPNIEIYTFAVFKVRKVKKREDLSVLR